MKKFRNILLGILAAGMLTIAAPIGGISAFASSAKISFSDPSATVGQEFSVNVKITSQDGNLGASDVVLSYDPSVIEFVSGNNASGGAGSIRLVGTMDSSSTKAFSYTLKFKAVQAGNTTISVGSCEVYDADAKAVTISKQGTSSVKVKAQSTSSTEAALSSLKISPGTLSPAFSPSVTSYTAQVGSDVDKLAVSASAKDSKAKVLVSGDSGLKVGSNTVVCKVTAEDGQTTKNYTITVNKLDTIDVPSEAETQAQTESESAESSSVAADSLNVEIDGVTYTIASEFDSSLIPEGYTQTTCQYGDFEVQCATGNDLTLLYLQSADGNGAFYIYLPESGTLSPYVTIDVTAKSILVLPPDESVQIPEGFVETTIQLNGTYKVQGWVWKSDEEQQYCVVYGMNENGEKSLYRYDIAEKTFQRYFEDPSLATKYDDAQVEEIIDKYNDLCSDYNIRFIIIAVLGVVCMILFFIVLNLLMRRKPSREVRKVKNTRQNKRRTTSGNVHSSEDAAGEDSHTIKERKDERRSEHSARKTSDTTRAGRSAKSFPDEERDEARAERQTRSVSGEKRTGRPSRLVSDEERTECRTRSVSGEKRTGRPSGLVSDEERTERKPRTSSDDIHSKRPVRTSSDERHAETSTRASSDERRSKRKTSIESDDMPARRQSRAVYDEERKERPVRRTSKEENGRLMRTGAEKSNVRRRNERSELYYTLDREDFCERPTRYESDTERSRRAREAKRRLERELHDDDGFEYIDDPE